MNPPAPNPVSGLSVTNEVRTAATAASTALPPRAARRPASAVSGWPGSDRTAMLMGRVGAAGPGGARTQGGRDASVVDAYVRESPDGIARRSQGLAAAGTRSSSIDRSRRGSNAGPRRIAATTPRSWSRRLAARLGAPSRPAAAAVEAGGDDGHPDLVGQRLVDVGAEDDVGVGMRGLLDHLGGLGDLEQAQVRPAGDREQDRAGAVDRGLEEWRGDRPLGCGDRPVSPVPMPIPSSAWPASRIVVRTSAKSRLIRPGSVISSEMPWTPWRSTSSATWKASIIVVVARQHGEQPLVRDDDQRVDLGAQRLDALLGLLRAPGALEA